jgi:hypothetical protein
MKASGEAPLESGWRKRARRYPLPKRRIPNGPARQPGPEPLARNGTAHRRAGHLVPRHRPTGNPVARTPDVAGDAANARPGKMPPGKMRPAAAELAVPAAKMRSMSAPAPAAAVSAAALRLRLRRHGKGGCGQEYDCRGECAHLPHDRVLRCADL